MSGKTIVQKLFLKHGYKFIIINEPNYYRNILGPLPAGVDERKRLSKEMDIIQYFVVWKIDLMKDLIKLRANLKDDGFLWIAYPKGTSKVETDLNRDIILNITEEQNMKAVTMISIDNIWTALRCKKV